MTAHGAAKGTAWAKLHGAETPENVTRRESDPNFGRIWISDIIHDCHCYTSSGDPICMISSQSSRDVFELVVSVSRSHSQQTCTLPSPKLDSEAQ